MCLFPFRVVGLPQFDGATFFMNKNFIEILSKKTKLTFVDCTNVNIELRKIAKKREIQYIIDGNGCFVVINKKPSRGYIRFVLNGDHCYLHRASKFIFGRDKILACHRCDNRLCFNPDHIFLGTQKQNMMDCLSKNRFSQKGSSHTLSKLKDSDIIDIRNSSLSLSILGNLYGVTKQTIYAVKQNKTWRHI